jgi:replicative DNA helicase
VLKAWSQDVIEVDRLGREGGQVHSPTLTKMLAVQPGVLKDLGGESIDRLIGRGLLPRYLFSMPKPLQGERDPDPPAVPKGLREAYERNMRRLLDQSFVEDAKPIELTLSDEAKSACAELVAYVTSVSGEGGEMEHFSDFLAKLEAHFVRLMGMLFAATYFGERTEMDGEMASKARLVIDYFQEQAEAVFEALNLSPEKRELLRAFGFVRRLVRDKGSREIKASQVYARARKSIDRTELYGLLVQLAKVGYLRELPKTHGNSSPLYEVNPKAL